MPVDAPDTDGASTDGQLPPAVAAPVVAATATNDETNQGPLERPKRAPAVVRRWVPPYFEGCRGARKLPRRDADGNIVKSGVSKAKPVRHVALSSSTATSTTDKARRAKVLGGALDSAIQSSTASVAATTKTATARPTNTRTGSAGVSTRLPVTSTRFDDYWTPDGVFDVLAAEYGPFTLDVAASSENTRAPRYYTVATNGLTQSWEGRVWCNPPYGAIPEKSDGLLSWIERAITSTSTGTARTVVILAPCYTESRWYSKAIAHAHEIVHIRGRLVFGGPNTKKGQAKNASVAIVFLSTAEQHARYGVSGGQRPFIGMTSSRGDKIEWISRIDETGDVLAAAATANVPVDTTGVAAAAAADGAAMEVDVAEPSPGEDASDSDSEQSSVPMAITAAAAASAGSVAESAASNLRTGVAALVSMITGL